MARTLRSFLFQTVEDELQWLSMTTEVECHIRIVELCIATVNCCVVVWTNQNHVLFIVFPTSTEPVDIMPLAQGHAVDASRVPEAYLALAFIQLLEISHQLLVAGGRLSGQIFAPLLHDSSIFFLHEIFNRSCIAYKQRFF